MGRNVALVMCGVLMVAIIVAVDLLFFRHHFRARLIANIAIVLVFAIFCFLVLKRK